MSSNTSTFKAQGHPRKTPRFATPHYIQRHRPRRPSATPKASRFDLGRLNRIDFNLLARLDPDHPIIANARLQSRLLSDLDSDQRKRTSDRPALVNRTTAERLPVHLRGPEANTAGPGSLLDGRNKALASKTSHTGPPAPGPATASRAGPPLARSQRVQEDRTVAAIPLPTPFKSSPFTKTAITGAPATNTSSSLPDMPSDRRAMESKVKLKESTARERMTGWSLLQLRENWGDLTTAERRQIKLRPEDRQIAWPRHLRAPIEHIQKARNNKEVKDPSLPYPYAFTPPDSRGNKGRPFEEYSRLLADLARRKDLSSKQTEDALAEEGCQSTPASAGMPSVSSFKPVNGRKLQPVTHRRMSTIDNQNNEDRSSSRSSEDLEDSVAEPVSMRTRERLNSDICRSIEQDEPSPSKALSRDTPSESGKDRWRITPAKIFQRPPPQAQDPDQHQSAQQRPAGPRQANFKIVLPSPSTREADPSLSTRPSAAGKKRAATAPVQVRNRTVSLEDDPPERRSKRSLRRLNFLAMSEKARRSPERDATCDQELNDLADQAIADFKPTDAIARPHAVSKKAQIVDIATEESSDEDQNPRDKFFPEETPDSTKGKAPIARKQEQPPEHDADADPVRADKALPDTSHVRKILSKAKDRIRTRSLGRRAPCNQPQLHEKSRRLWESDAVTSCLQEVNAQAAKHGQGSKGLYFESKSLCERTRSLLEEELRSLTKTGSQAVKAEELQQEGCANDSAVSACADCAAASTKKPAMLGESRITVRDDHSSAPVQETPLEHHQDLIADEAYERLASFLMSKDGSRYQRTQDIAEIGRLRRERGTRKNAPISAELTRRCEHELEILHAFVQKTLWHASHQPKKKTSRKAVNKLPLYNEAIVALERELRWARSTQGSISSTAKMTSRHSHQFASRTATTGQAHHRLLLGNNSDADSLEVSCAKECSAESKSDMASGNCRSRQDAERDSFAQTKKRLREQKQDGEPRTKKTKRDPAIGTDKPNNNKGNSDSRSTKLVASNEEANISVLGVSCPSNARSDWPPRETCFRAQSPTDEHREREKEARKARKRQEKEEKKRKRPKKDAWQAKEQRESNETQEERPQKDDRKRRCRDEDDVKSGGVGSGKEREEEDIKPRNKEKGKIRRREEAEDVAETCARQDEDAEQARSKSESKKRAASHDHDNDGTHTPAKKKRKSTDAPKDPKHVKRAINMTEVSKEHRPARQRSQSQPRPQSHQRPQSHHRNSSQGKKTQQRSQSNTRDQSTHSQNAHNQATHNQTHPANLPKLRPGDAEACMRVLAVLQSQR